MNACIGTPISWLRLETYAVDMRDATVAKHLGECPACHGCFAQIRDDVVALPALIGSSPSRPKRNWLWWLAPAMAAAAAAILLLVIVRRSPAPDHVTTIKGGRQVVLGVVRERSGSIRRDVTTYAAGDRWKLTLTCSPDPAFAPSSGAWAGPFVWVDVAVVDPKGVDHPLSPAQLSCGNEIVVPGAFEITGRDANVVCVVLDPDVIPPRTPPVPGTPGTACVTLTPE